MIVSLFSRFDPYSSILLFKNWLRIGLVFSLILSYIWLIPNRFNFIIKNIIITLHKEFKTLLGPEAHLGRTIIFLTLFILIVFNNFFGLFPYIFTRTRHLVLTLRLAAPIWLSFILFGWINHRKYIFAHLVPQSTPVALIPFIVLIESIRNVIRPGTLAVRLSANIIAGHLLITLLGNQTAEATSITLIILLLIQVVLLILESAVAIIQAYVFSILSTLYSSEITSH